MDDKEKDIGVRDGAQEMDSTDTVPETGEGKTTDRKESETSVEAKRPRTDRSKGVHEDGTLEDVIRREAKEEQDVSSPFSISKTLGGGIIAHAFQKQIGLVLLVSVFLIIYISNRYICQKKMVEIDKVEAQMVEARYKATVCTSILTEKSRESNIMRMLKYHGDSTLTIPNEPPYLIRTEE